METKPENNSDVQSDAPLEAPSEPNWHEIDRICDLYSTGSVVHYLDSSRKILKSYWEAGEKMGWPENLRKYYEMTKQGLEKTMVKIRVAHQTGQLPSYSDLFKD